MFRTVTYRINKEKNGIELLYGYIPSINIRDTLKKNGWHWNPKDQVWYTRYSEEALTFAKRQSRQTENRQVAIDKMPAFYRKHCGCEESNLLLLEENVFYKYVKHGSLKSIATELLLEYIFDDSLSFLKELYIQSAKNENYRKELLLKVPKDLYLISKDGSVSLKGPTQNTSKDISIKLGLQQGIFWTNLEVFGIHLRPVDRIAYQISNYRNSCLAHNKNYYCAASIQERYLFSIVEHLTLDYDDTLTRIIKEHLKSEINEILSQKDEINFYLLALYALIINDRKQADIFLSEYIDQITPKKVILNIEKKRTLENH